MFKKKGGLAFKPKIPSARPRAPAPAAPTTKPVDDPVTVDSSLNESAQQARERSETAEAIANVESASQTPDTHSVEPPNRVVTPAASDPAIADKAPSQQPSQPPPARLSHVEKESTTTQHHVAVDPNLAEVSTGPKTTTTINQAVPTTEPVTLLATANTQITESAPHGNTTQAPPEQVERTLPGLGTEPMPTPPPSGKTAPATKPRAKRQASAPAGSGDATDTAKPKKRQRKAVTENGDTPQPRPRQRRNNSDNPVKSRRARSLTPEDAENQVVDLQKLKMSDLTKDLHIGKKFSRHDELRERERQAKLKSKLGRDSAPPEIEGSNSTDDIRAKSGTPTNTTESGAAPAAGPQFRIVDGQIIVDQSSLVMDRHARAAAARAGEDIETIEENDFTRLITSSSFMNTSKLRGPNIWTDEETELFYRALRMFGTDFEIISKMFPHKQRRHIKLKFNREERHCPRRIDAALVGQKTIRMDIDEYKAATGSEFEAVEDIEAEQRKIAEDFEAERKRVADEQEEMMRKKREELFADDDEATSKKKKGKKKGKQAVSYGLNGEPIYTEA